MSVNVKLLYFCDFLSRKKGRSAGYSVRQTDRYRSGNTGDTVGNQETQREGEKL